MQEFKTCSHIEIPTDKIITGMVSARNGMFVITANEVFFLRKLRWYERAWRWFVQ